MNRQITINSRKFGGEIHKSWKAELLNETQDLFELVGEFDREIEHSILGVIRRGTVSYEYYWKENWFSVFRFHQPEGVLRNFYCNINQPPTLSDGVLDYVDLDIDVLVQPDYSYRILDLDEFQENRWKLNYPQTLLNNVDDALQNLIRMIESRQFPFDY